MSTPGRSGFAERLRDVRRQVTRAIRLDRANDAAEAVAVLRDDFARGNVEQAVRVTLERAAEEAGARATYGRALAQWLLKSARAPGRTELPRDGYIRPEIVIEPDALPELIERLESALADWRLNIFWRGGRLMQVATILGPDDVESVRLIDISEDLLVDFGTQAAVWLQPSRKLGADPRPVNCPKNIAAGLIARRGMMIATAPHLTGGRLQQLTAVISAPTLRADGELLDLPGYDTATGFFLAHRADDFPDIPDRPSREQAADALAELADLLAEVSFKDDCSRSVALSAILTALVRPSLGAAPMHAITAPTPGTGKSYLVDLVALIATGATATPIAAGSTDEELEKRLAAALMAGEQFLSLDNVTRPVNGDLLNQMLTQERVSPRRLGKSENVETPCTAFMMANGNNLAIPADMTRRVLLCSLDANTERPELIERENDPRAAARECRGRFVSAGLTVLRGYIAAGRPGQPKPLGSFEAWSGLVRGALVWLGEADPVDSMEAVRAVDPRRAELVAIGEQWAAVIGDARCTVAEAIQAAAGAKDFNDALLVVANERGVVSPMRLGKWLARNRGVVIAGRRFEGGLLRRGMATWTLQGAPATPSAGDPAWE